MEKQNGSEREVVVVTGATGGVGRAVAREFARRGAAVAVLARGEAGLEQTAREIRELGGTALACPVDVADYDQVQSAAERVAAELGPIDIWINNAMTTVFSYFQEVEPAEYQRATKVTYLGAVWGTRVALRHMEQNGHGTIVQVGSALAHQGIPLQAPYCGAKHAMLGMHESLRCELRYRKSPVRATMVQLPGLNTPQFDHCLSKMPRHPMPVPPIFQPEVAARAVHWAAHHPRRREWFVGFSTLYTVVGNRMAPWLTEWYLSRNTVEAQMTDQPYDGAAASNLFEPVDSDHDEGAHGDFDRLAKPRSLQAMASRHRRLIGLCAGLPLAAGVGALSACKLRHRRRSRLRRLLED